MVFYEYRGNCDRGRIEKRNLKWFGHKKWRPKQLHQWNPTKRIEDEILRREDFDCLTQGNNISCRIRLIITILHLHIYYIYRFIHDNPLGLVSNKYIFSVVLVIKIFILQFTASHKICLQSPQIFYLIYAH